MPQASRSGMIVPPAVAADVPSTPTAPTVKALVGGLEVRWAEPNGNGAKVQYYMVSALPPGTRTWTVSKKLSCKTLSPPRRNPSAKIADRRWMR